MKKFDKITAYTHVGDYGQIADKFVVELSNMPTKISKEDFQIENNFNDLSGYRKSEGITDVNMDDSTITIKVDPFVYRYAFKITYKDISFSKEDVDEVKVKDIDTFSSCEENGVIYRLYEPENKELKPLVLFLHGGGECGTDNLHQMLGTLGALHLAQRWPDMYIMAPHAPEGNVTLEEMVARMEHGDIFKVIVGKNPESGKGDRGWNRDYLSRVCHIIRKMINKGQVDARRVYVIGMSMGGAGTLRALSVDPGLFAAAVPICPSMNGETYTILNELPKVPVWIATSYIDHQTSRHAYILSACQNLWRKGRTDVRYTIFNEEELAEYGIGTTPGISTKELYAENHNSWIPVLHNEHGILDWMISHVK